MKKVGSAIIIVIILVSCSTVKYTPVNSALPSSKKIDSVYILTPKQNVAKTASVLGTWEQVEDWNFSWEHLITKLKAKAVSAGADILKIDEYFIGSKTKGHGVLLRGSFYNANGLPISNDVDTLSLYNCSLIHVFRDEGNAGLRGLFKMDLAINDSLIGALPNKKTYTIKLLQEGEVKIGTSKKSANLFKNELGKEYYVQATQDMGSTNSGGMMAINVGSKIFVLQENISAKIQFETLENLKEK